jgi:hypothetical protein
MSPAYPDTDENIASLFGLADGRASVVINTEWPMIRADIDAGHPSPLGLVCVKSLLPWDLGSNHQVLAYAYLESGSDVTLWVYDPNQPNNDNVTIRFSTRAWDVPIDIKHNVAVTDRETGQRRPIYGLFRTNYSARSPMSQSIMRGSGVCAAVARTSSNLDLFVTGNDGVVYTSWWGAGNEWSGIANNWRPIGGFFPIGAPVGAVSRDSGQLHLFVVGNDGIVYTSWWDTGADWSGVANNWKPIGGFFPEGAPVTATARRPDVIDLFVVGNDGVVYTSWWAAGKEWSGVANNWRPIGGFFPKGARVSAVARTDDSLDLFVVGNDGVVYTSWWSAGQEWSGVANNWRPIGGFFQVGAPVTAVARTPNNLDLFVVGNDGVVYTSWWSAGQEWSGVANNWRPIGGFFPTLAPVAAVARTGENLDLFVVGNDGVVYTSWWHNDAEWSGIGNNWRPLGGFFPRATPIAAVARAADHLDLFVIGNNGVVYTSWWHAGTDWSGVANNWKPIGGFFPVSNTR